MIDLFKRKAAKRAEERGTSELLYNRNGIRIWGWNAAQGLPTRRYLAYLLAANEGELGIGRPDILAFAKGVSDSINAGNISRAGWYAETLKAYLDDYPPEKVIFKMICPIVRLDGEREAELLPEFTKRKAELFEGNEDVRAFFLQHGYEWLRAFGFLSKNTKREDFLRVKSGQSERTFSKLTGSDTYTDYLTK